MKKEEIEKWLTRYYEGQTSEQEEEDLRRFFLTADDLPECLQTERDLFLSLHADATADIPVPADLEAGLEALIARKAGTMRRRWLRWGSMAASFLLVVGMGIAVMEGRQEERVTQDTFTNPEEAHRALQAVFTELSQNWNEGMKQLEDSQRDIMAVNREVRNELEHN